MTPFFFLVCLALVTATPSLTELDNQIKQHQLELEQSRQQLTEVQQRIAELAKSEKTTLARIEAYREQIALVNRHIGQLDAQIRARTEEIVRATQQIEETSAKIEARKQDLARRLVYIYKYGLLLPVETLLSAKGIADIHRKVFLLRQIARADKGMAEELQALEARLSEQRAGLLAARTDLEQLKQERLDKQQALEASKAAESMMLERVRTEHQAKQALEAELSAAAARLEQLIADLQQRRQEQLAASGSHYFEVNKGKLPWPVRGEVLARFGSRVHPQYGTRTNNLGIDIQTQPGTLVLCIAAGKVAYADHFMGYGKMVIVDHSAGFYTLHANLAEISTTVGAEVISGSALGKTKDHLHFEIRKDGKPIDPLPWLAP